MKIKYGENNEYINILEGDKVKMSFHFISDEFAVEFYGNESVIVNKNDDLIFYNMIKEFMSNEYVFCEFDLSRKDGNNLEWLSDEYGDLEDPNSTDFMTRLIIKLKDDNIEFYEYKPYFIKNNINMPHLITLFSPSGNGRYNYNKKTRSTLQTDLVTAIIKEKDKTIIKRR